jgi:hypothetical protein
MVLISVPLKRGKMGSQNSAVLLQQLESERFAALGKCSVADHVRKHDGGQPTLFSCDAHAKKLREFIPSDIWPDILPRNGSGFPGVAYSFGPPASDVFKCEKRKSQV